ncbi:MAG: hypothetical protein IJP28_03200 [Erysipelotrichales bacterium]|nr:hypothetical protein [Erysipelotrichales bacterium]
MRKGRKIISCLLALLLSVGCTMQEVEVEKKGNVYYEIFVSSFYDSDGNGVGDLKGVEEKLEYLDDLGISGIWLMPIMPSPTYHKYDVVDYMSIDPAYGTMEDFESLVQSANEKNIDIIIDLVLNHSSSQHPWFQEAVSSMRNGTCEREDSYCDYYVFSDEKLANYYPVLGTDQYYEGVFTSEMPDLNLESEALRKDIEEIVDFWMAKGIKGFRLDAIMHYYGGNTAKNVEFLTWFNELVRSKREDAYIVGEAWTSSETVAKYYESGISCFDFALSQADGKIVSTIRSGRGNALATIVSSYQDQIISYDTNAMNSIFISNHDQGRSAAYFYNSNEQTKLMASVYLLLPGTPFVYYGEEIGMLGSGKDENKRLGYVWDSTNNTGKCNDPSGADYTKKIKDGLAQQQKDKDSLYSHYKKVITLRNQHSSYVNGTHMFIESGNEAVYMIESENEEESILTIHNFSPDTVIVECPVEYTNITGEIILTTGKSKLSNNTLEIPGMSTVIMEKSYETK